jgi:hypothetical protein
VSYVTAVTDTITGEPATGKLVRRVREETHGKRTDHNAGTAPVGLPHINAFTPLLDRVDLTGVILTADALHTQTRHVTYLHRRHAHWILTVKANHPCLLKRLRGLPWRDMPMADRTYDKGHCRLESRTVKVTGVAAGIGFPYARQMQWLGEVSGLHDSLRHIADKKQQAERLRQLAADNDSNDHVLG